MMTRPAHQPLHHESSFPQYTQQTQQSGGTFAVARKARNLLRRVPVWTWRVLMHSVKTSENTRFNVDPIAGVDYVHDIDFVGDGIRAHRLDVITPRLPNGTTADGTTTGGTTTAADACAPRALPVYVYFHGGGWTSGDKASLTKYCASQAAGGMVAVNVNYRKAPRFQMAHVLADANAALAWVRQNIAGYGGDPSRIVLGGDSAGGQIAALLTAASFRPELAKHHGLTPAVPASDFKGLVQHCSVVDFSVFFDKGFVLSLNFIRMLLPGLRSGARNRGIGGGLRLRRLRRQARRHGHRGRPIGGPPQGRRFPLADRMAGFALPAGLCDHLGAGLLLRRQHEFHCPAARTFRPRGQPGLRLGQLEH